MRRALVTCLIALACAAGTLLPGCNGGGDSPGSHTLALGGVSHLEGHINPLAFCASCHGAALRGGKGPSCYQCHDSGSHNTVRSGRRHRAGQDSSCTICHGPDNSGGLGPACSNCH